MRIVLLLLVWALMLPSSYSQTQISDFKGEGTSHINYLRVVDGEPYLININQSNLISVYQIVSKDSKVLLHQQKAEFSFFERDIEFTDQALHYCFRDTIYSYDFKENDMIKTAFPEYQRQSYISYQYGSTFLVNASSESPTVHTYAVYTPGNALKFLDESVQSISGNFLFDPIVDGGTNRDYKAINLNTDESTIFIEDFLFYQYPEASGDLIYYLNNNHDLMSYDVISGSHEVIVNIEMGLSSFNRVILQDGLIHVLSTGLNNFKATSFSLEQNMIINQQYFETTDVVRFYDIQIEGSIIFAQNDEELFLINFQNDTSIKRSRANTIRNLDIIDHKFVLNIYYDANNDYKSEIIYLDDFDIKSISGNQKMGAYIDAAGFEINEDYVVVLARHYNAAKSIFNVHLDSHTFESLDVLDDGNNGFHEFSLLKDMGDTKLLIADNYYSIVDEELIQINQFPLDDVTGISNFLVGQEEFYFIESETGDLMSYDGVDLTVVYDSLTEIIYPRVYSYLPTRDEIYMPEAGVDLIRINRLTQNIDTLESDFDYQNFLSFNNRIYFRDYEQIYSIEATQQIQIFDSNEFIYFDLFVVDDYLFYYLDEGLYRVNDLHEKLLFKALDPFSLSQGEMIISPDEKQFMINKEDSNFLLYHHGEMITVPGNFDQYHVHFYKDEFIIYLNDEGESVLYKMSDDTFEMIDDQVDGDIIDLYGYDDNAVLVTSERFQNVITVREYSLNEDYEISALLRVSDFNFKYFGNANFEYGPIASIDQEVYVLKNNEYDDSAELANFNYSEYGISSEEGVYILLNDKTQGRQLFFQSYGQINGIDEHFVENEFNVFPNPSIDKIVLPTNFKEKDMQSYSIFSSDGRRVLHGLLKKEIDVQALPSGNYFLSILAKDESFNVQFVKI